MLYLAAGILFTTILVRLIKSASVQAKVLLSFLFVLYLGLFLLKSFTSSLPPWFHSFYALTVTGGILWLLGESGSRFLMRHYHARLRFKDLKKQKGPFFEIIMASRLLSRANMGALIVISRKEKLNGWYQKGVCVDASLSKEILFSIFTPPGTLHDGATFVHQDRVMCSGVIVPLTRNPNLSKELGTRHRAAVGLSEACDALCVIVSEETGAISLADRGALYYDIPFEKLPEVLDLALKFKLKKKYKSMKTKLEEAPLVFG